MDPIERRDLDQLKVMLKSQEVKEIVFELIEEERIQREQEALKETALRIEESISEPKENENA